MLDRRNRRIVPLLAACLLGGTGWWGAEARGQQVISMSVSVGGPAGDGGATMVNRRFVERAGRVAGMSPEQAEQAGVIHEGYASAYEARRKAFRDALEEIRQSSDDAGDFSAYVEKLAANEKAFREDTAKLEADFMTDVRSLLTPSQEPAWPKVERLRRREVGLPAGSLSGESVDVLSIIEAMGLSAADRATLAPILDQYEVELDRLMVVRLQHRDERPGWTPGKPIDVEEIRASKAKAKEEGIKVRDLHRDCARKVEPLLPEGVRATFRERVQAASFPRVYRKGRTLRELDAAAAMSDLDDAQRSLLADLRASYERDAAPVNAAWAKAIEESETEGQAGGAGGGVVLSFGDESEGLREARKARRELDEQVSKRLRGVLNASQQDRLPKAGQGDGDEVQAEGNAVIIRRSE